MASHSGRNPYPFPTLENDTNFSGQMVKKSMKVSETGASVEGLDPWTRLYSTPTLSSTRRDVTYFDSQVPQNSLDFVLKCEYDHHSEFMKSKASVLQQPETTGENHGRVLKNRPTVQSPVLLEDQSLVCFEDKKKGSINTSKGLSIAENFMYCI
jgi:hypothetical protein